MAHRLQSYGELETSSGTNELMKHTAQHNVGSIWHTSLAFCVMVITHSTKECCNDPTCTSPLPHASGFEPSSANWLGRRVHSNFIQISCGVTAVIAALAENLIAPCWSVSPCDGSTCIHAALMCTLRLRCMDAHHQLCAYPCFCHRGSSFHQPCLPFSCMRHSIWPGLFHTKTRC